jgi:Cdc6-like AAA superfamily ATPase
MERPSKKPKLAENVADLTTALVDDAIASLVVEPCDAARSYVMASQDVSLPRLIGREKECALIESHFKAIFESGQPRPLYVCGTPGSGKTASISKIMSHSTKDEDPQKTTSKLAPYSVKINCATDTLGTSSNAIYSVLLDRLIAAFDASDVSSKIGASTKGTKPAKMTDQEFLPILLKRLNEYHIKYTQANSDQHKPLLILVLLDEVDHLLITKTALNAELHFLFSSWKEVWGILSIVAISNTHDLFERYLPLLSVSGTSSKDAGPGGVTIVQFAPYTSEQLTHVLDARLKSKTTESIDSASLSSPKSPSASALFDSKALLFLTAKISKLPGDQAGDARILIDLAKTSLIEARKMKKVPVTIDVVAKVWRVKMTPSNLDPIAQLTLNQKAALICMILATNALPSATTTVRPSLLEATWKQILPQVFFSSSPSLSDLYSAISLLEGIGHVRILAEKGNRKSYKLASKETVMESLRKDLLFKDLLP